MTKHAGERGTAGPPTTLEDGRVKPIETRYSGRHYRSRLEARWAVFFDTLGIRFDYEPEGFKFDCTDGVVCYLPDFWLRDYKCWVEIKPGHLNHTEWRKCSLLASHGWNVFVFTGQIDPTHPPKPRLFSGVRFNDGFVEEYDDVGYPWSDDLVWPDQIEYRAFCAAASAQFEFQKPPPTLVGAH